MTLLEFLVPALFFVGTCVAAWQRELAIAAIAGGLFLQALFGIGVA